MSTNLVIEASKCVVEAPRGDQERYEQLLGIKASLLPAEAAARAELEGRLADLERRQRGEQKGKRLGLSVLSPEIFSWKKAGLPAFAVYAVQGEGDCILSSDPAKEKIPAPCREFYRNVLPKPWTQRLQQFFTDHFKAIWCFSALAVEAGYFYAAQAPASATWGRFLLGLMLGVLASFCASLMCLIVVIAGWTLAVREVETTARSRFLGTIPNPVKRRIRQFEGEFQEILIVAEADWQVAAKAQAFKLPAAVDPLVVGWDGDFFWLIDRFNTSSLEELVASEFAVKGDDLESVIRAS